MKKAVALCLCGFSISLFAQHYGSSLNPHEEAQAPAHFLRSGFQTRQTSEMRDAKAPQKFTSPDGVFRFMYSNLLVRRLEGKESAGSAGPVGPCGAYFPMCKFQISPGSNTLVCFAYERNKFKFTDRAVLEAGTFSVAKVKDASTESECAKLPGDWGLDSRGEKVIHGAKFKVFDVSEGEMNQRLDGQVYRNFHKDTCYELRVRIATGSAGVEGGTVYEFSKDDWKEVHDPLEEALDSFRFLK